MKTQGFRTDIRAGALSVLLLLFSLAGCVSPTPLKMLGNETFAVIYTVPTKCIARGACVSRVLLKAINGEGVGNFSTRYNFKISPGPVSVIVWAYPVLGDPIKNVSGICELKWVAVAGDIYEVDRTIEANGFLVTAKTPDGEPVASCTAPFSPF